MTHLLGETFEICFKNIIATVALLRKLGFTFPGSYTTDNIPGVCDRLCQNGNNSEERKHPLISFTRMSFQITRQQSEN